MICLIYKFKTSLKSNVNMRFERFVQNTTHSLILIINHVTNENKNNDMIKPIQSLYLVTITILTSFDE